jgi:integrase
MKSSYLYARNGYFHFVIKVPVKLRKKFGYRFVRKSLNTKSLLEAQYIANILSSSFKQLFMDVKTDMLTEETIKEIATEIFESGLRGLEKSRIEGENNTILADTLPAAKKALAENNTDPFVPFIDKILAEKGEAVSKDSIEYKILLRDILKAFVEICEIEKERVGGNFLNEYDKMNSFTAHVSKKRAQQPQDKAPKMLLSKLITDYVKEHTTDNKWGEKSKIEYNAFFDNLIEIMGDVDINSIDRNKINTFKEKLIRIPANRNKKHQFKGKSIDEILSMDDVQPMSLSRINKNLTVVSSMFKWAKKYGYVKDNYAESLQIKITHKSSDERKVYDKDDLIRITQKLSEMDRKNQPDDFWIPLIAMLNGMRQNEICQLHKEDIITQDGIPCFDVNNNHIGKKVKNRASERIVPVHPCLIEIGFLDYVKSVEDGHLWKSLKCHEYNGFAYLYQKRYSNFNRKYITQDKKKVFHSFRHTFINNLKQSGVIEQRIAEIVGHTTGSIDMERYGKAYNPKVLLDTLEKLDYGFDIIKESSEK